MWYLLVRHKVTDFDSWKSVFSSHERAAREAGMVVIKVLRNVENPNEVFLLFEIEDIERARAFVSAPGVPRAREESGVVDEPDIYFLF